MICCETNSLPNKFVSVFIASVTLVTMCCQSFWQTNKFQLTIVQSSAYIFYILFVACYVAASFVDQSTLDTVGFNAVLMQNVSFVQSLLYFVAGYTKENKQVTIFLLFTYAFAWVLTFSYQTHSYLLSSGKKDHIESAIQCSVALCYMAISGWTPNARGDNSFMISTFLTIISILVWTNAPMSCSDATIELGLISYAFNACFLLFFTLMPEIEQHIKKTPCV
jgi:hypothetical protein